MTTKRELILKAIAMATEITMDDLIQATGIDRHAFRDNIKATVRDGLCERFNDDITNQPAYRLTPEGRKWLENAKDDKPKAVKAAPKPTPKAAPAPDIKAIQADMDTEVRLTMAGKTIIDFCEWLSDKLKVRCPMNLHECKTIVEGLIRVPIAPEVDLNAAALDLSEQLAHKNAEIENLEIEVSKLEYKIAQLQNNAALPLTTNTEPVRYIVCDNYIIAKDESEANDYAIKLAKEIEIDTPVMVFSSAKARELRINWRDA